MADVQKWKIKGQWFDVCRCAVPCPCSWAQPPDDDFCEGILLWHIQEGHYGSLDLDGLNMAMVVTFKGNIWGGNATDLAQAFFVDERASEAQRGALQTVFSGQAGGWPKLFGELTRNGQIRGMEAAKIRRPHRRRPLVLERGGRGQVRGRCEGPARPDERGQGS
jgi:hypothetical protein